MRGYRERVPARRADRASEGSNGGRTAQYELEQHQVAQMMSEEPASTGLSAESTRECTPAFRDLVEAAR